MLQYQFDWPGDDDGARRPWLVRRLVSAELFMEIAPL